MSATIECYNPADTRERVSSYPLSDPAAVAAACERAATAAEAWARTPGPRRAGLLFRAATLLEERAEAVGREITREEGKVRADALGEALRAAAILRFHAGEAERASGEFGDAGDPGAVAFTRRRPLGVVGLITPWNFPIAIPAWKAAPAMAAGNVVVIKPSSRAPGGTLALLVVLRDAGLPDDVFQVVCGEAEVGQALVDNPLVRAVSFTGSNAVGEMLRQRVGARGARFQGELGGNNPLIVLGDADLEHAVATAVSGAFGAAGQKCTATRRVIVEAPVYERFVELSAKRAAALRVGPGLEDGVAVPPLVDRLAQSQVLGAIRDDVGAGAEVVVGGGAGPDEHGCYVEPTIVVGAAPGMAMIDTEVFGPVCAVLEAADRAAAVELANATPFGLSASICTNDLGAVMDFVAHIDAGMVHVNRPTPGADPHLPFGGLKASSGSPFREQGRAAAAFYTESQTVYIQAGPH